VQGSEEYFGRLYLLRDRTLEHETEQLYAGVSSVADENLRAPAARVVSLATRLLEGAGGDLSDVQTRLLTTLRANAERQIALIDAMSEAARLESDQMRLSVAPVDLHALLHNTATAMRPLLQQTHQTLTVDVPADLPTIEGDADRLAQALTNLISNAHRFNQAGGWVRVEARMRGKRVRVVVSDGGLGIARADQQRIFARFARVENDQTRSLTGSGLGLAAVAQIVRLHGGEVEVQSELGEGSTFALLLPLTQLKVVADSAPVLEDDVAEPAAMKPVADDPADGADAAPIETPADEAPADEAQPASDALVAEADVDGADAQLPDAPAKQEADATAVDMAAPTTSVHADVVELPASEPVVMEPEGGTEQDAVVEPTASVDTPVVTEPVAPVEIGAASEAEPAGESEPEEGPEPAAELADDHLPANGTGRSDVPEAEAVAEPEPTAVQPDQAPPEQGAAGTEETAETVHAAAELTGAEGAPAEAALDTRVPEEPAPAEDEIAPATADQAATAHTHSTVDESSGDEAPVPFLAPSAGEDERPAAPAPTATAVDPLEPDEPAEPAEPDLASKAHDGAEPPRDDEADAEPHAAGGPEAIDASDGADITDAADAATPDAGAPVAIAYDPLEDAPVLADDEPPPADEPPPLAAFDPLEEEDPFDDPRSTGTPP
jgi:hypothetical protein